MLLWYHDASPALKGKLRRSVRVVGMVVGMVASMACCLSTPAATLLLSCPVGLCCGNTFPDLNNYFGEHNIIIMIAKTT